MRYKSKPVVIDAIYFDGENGEECVKFCNGFAVLNRTNESSKELICQTMNGGVVACSGNWIIANDKECYPCVDEVFQGKYESADG